MTEQKYPIVRIGKSGITAGIIDEIKRHLRQSSILKVKFLSSFMKDKDKKSVAQELADSVGAIVQQRVGFTVVLKK